MSVPRLNPESISTGKRPSTAAITSGSAPIVERPLASARPPWFDTTMPAIPLSTQRSASSPVEMPLTINCIDVESCMRLMKSIVNDGPGPSNSPDASISSNMRLPLLLPPG